MVVPLVMGKSFSITSVTRFSRSTSSFYFYFLFIFFFFFFIDLFILSNRMTKVTPFETWSVTLQNDTNKGIKFEEDPQIVVEFKTTGILSTPSDMNPALAMSSSPSSSGTLPSTSPSPFHQSTSLLHHYSTQFMLSIAVGASLFAAPSVAKNDVLWQLSYPNSTFTTSIWMYHHAIV